MTPFPSDPSRRHFLAAAGLLGGGLLASPALAGGEPPLAPPDRQPPDLKLPEPAPKKLGWAVVGLGVLALEEILPAFKLARFCKPTALVSGHPDKAKRVAAGYEIDPKNVYDYENYDKLADNPAVDVIYVVLPNSMHAEYTVRGLKAGKHVLCEKPMAPTVGECRTMIEAAKAADRKLMIAYRLHYEPFNRTAIDVCRSGALGKIKLISASNGQNTPAPNIRFSKKLGGGPVGDVGIYCLNAARYLTGEEPTEVTAAAYQPKDDPRFREVPESVVFSLRFPSGALANCDCSFGSAESRRFRVDGTDAFLDMEKAFGYRGQRLFLDRPGSVGAAEVRTVLDKAGLKGVGQAALLDRVGRHGELKIEPVNHFAAEMDHMAESIMANRQPRTPGEEGLADMRIIAAIEEAAASGKSVSLKG